MAEKREKRYVSDNAQLMAEWNWGKNNELGFNPNTLTLGSTKKVWWKCPKGHEWQARVADRNSGHGCPFCSGNRVLAGFNDLETLNPQLAKEWHPTKNDNISPNMVTSTSHSKVWWLGGCGHEWQATVNHRSKGRGCPICANSQILLGFNDLATTNPNLAKEWHPTKNKNITPKMVVAGSAKKVWWLGKCGHEWPATISSRVSGKGCPICSGRQVLQGFNDLATRNPNLAKEWHPTKNNNLTPEMTVSGSDKLVWWIGRCGHEWSATIKDRIRGRACPFCAGKKILAGYNDLATTNPLLAKEWHPSKNGELTPKMVVAGSAKKVWWMCKKGHEWQAVIASRVNGRNCPTCGKELQTSFPEQAVYYYVKQFFPDAINSDKVTVGVELDIYIPSIKYAIEYDGLNWHKNNQFEKEKNYLCVSHDIRLIRIREEGLALFDDCYCITRNDCQNNNSLNAVILKVLRIVDPSIEADVDIIRDETLILESYMINEKSKSLQSTHPQIAAEWHPTKNGKLKPEHISYGSKKRVWWKCVRGHEWQASAVDRIRGNNCPFCSSRKVLKDFNDLMTKNPTLAKEWHPTKNGDLRPDMVTSGSSQKVWWHGECGHEWQASIHNRSRGSGCPYCSGRYAIKGENDLQTVNPTLAKEWNYEKNNGLTPTDVLPNSNKKVWWKCSKGHEWEAKINDRNKGSGCPICRKNKKQKNR